MRARIELGHIVQFQLARDRLDEVERLQDLHLRQHAASSYIGSFEAVWVRSEPWLNCGTRDSIRIWFRPGIWAKSPLRRLIPPPQPNCETRHQLLASPDRTEQTQKVNVRIAVAVIPTRHTDTPITRGSNLTNMVTQPLIRGSFLGEFLALSNKTLERSVALPAINPNGLITGQKTNNGAFKHVSCPSDKWAAKRAVCGWRPPAGGRHVAVGLLVLPAGTPRLYEATIQPYMIDSGDRLRITVFDQMDLTTPIPSTRPATSPSADRRCTRPRQTLQQLEGVVAAKLRQGFSRDPDVTIEVAVNPPPDRSSSWAKSARRANLPMCRA